VCKLHLRLGEVRYTHPIADSVLTDDEKVDGICLSCRAVPLTNVVVELQESDRLRRVLQLGFASRSTAGSATGPARPASRTPSPPAPDDRGSGQRSTRQNTATDIRKERTVMSVMRLGYVHIRVTDLEEARSHYSNTLGMRVVHEEPGKLWLKCWDEYDHHSLVIEEGGVGLVKLGYKCESEDDLVEYERRAQQFGATTGRVSKGENLTVGDGVAITLPSEQWLELYTEIDYLGTDTGALNPDPWPRDARHGITRGTTIYFFDPSGNRNEVFAGLGYRTFPDFPTVEWTEDQLAKGIVYIARELNDTFTTVFT
jgi:catechol 2,3-dioxygenase-like lactoylglutathione lyase family enzyme